MHLANENKMCADDIDYRVLTCSGDRSILYHLGSAETGLLEDFVLLFTGRKRSYTDYHTEINSCVILPWLENAVSPHIQQTGVRRVLVLDRATYHTMTTDDSRKPTIYWNNSTLNQL